MRHSDSEHPRVVLDRLSKSKPEPPTLDPRHELSHHHRQVANEHHFRRLSDHEKRLLAWEMTIADEKRRLEELGE